MLIKEKGHVQLCSNDSNCCVTTGYTVRYWDDDWADEEYFASLEDAKKFYDVAKEKNDELRYRQICLSYLRSKIAPNAAEPVE